MRCQGIVGMDPDPVRGDTNIDTAVQIETQQELPDLGVNESPAIAAETHHDCPEIPDMESALFNDPFHFDWAYW